MSSGVGWKLCGIGMLVLTSCGGTNDDECTDQGPEPDEIRVADAATHEGLCAASLTLAQDGLEAVLQPSIGCSYLVATESTYTATASAPGYLSESVTVPGAKCRRGVSRTLSLKKVP